MTVAIVDYGSGNLRSAAKAFERAAQEAGVGAAIAVTDDAEAVRRADRIVLPGVGAFADCMAGIRSVPGLVEAMEEAVLTRGTPFLGICVGMQLMAERGVEHGVWDGLGWIRGEVVAIDPADPSLKIPHMGWNDLHVERPDHPVLAGLHDGDHAYFVHSYRFACADRSTELASVDYGGPVAAVIGRDNLVGTQFHPEKSQASGLRLIANFLRWRP
ncbi:imidazole glycerol phosphate synthase subunit HisH [Skermanella sp. TT6]|uniref:Imidazole glycerol phosphate synthase subunit HisH n=1 Tax=Skermanella cutis TaxID=2775420 RepID=A0ABX7B8B2_9PROT|nr:imidazole glycerol phosphate synthase subunit HisH [Skermanella sp. TT6]QQP89553.1 imidazole glycerol phosphate synthase subunit HisH [Skermanella sp. TT6]